MGGNIEKTFFELMKAGLFPNFFELETACCPISRDEDWGDVYRMAEEQFVVGLVAEGIGWFKGHDSSFKIPQEWALRFIGQAMLIEQRNKAMNAFVAELVEGLRKRRVETLLMKGQGIAQCYEKPLWRTSGDVDLLLKGHDYTMAKFFLLPKSNRNNPERKYSKELGLSMGQWCVELHGTQRTGLSSRLDKKIDDLQRCAFNKMEDRLWMNGETRVFLPSVDEDVLLVFTHFLKHFYI